MFDPKRLGEKGVGVASSLNPRTSADMTLPVDGLETSRRALQQSKDIGDGAVVVTPSNHLAVTTNAFVVQPLFFPGGNIGQLSVYRTVNDLAMCGARPLYLSLSMILEEGLADMTRQDVVRAAQAAALEAGVTIVTTDTKVVEKRADSDGQPGLFLSTAGVGVIVGDPPIGPDQIRVGDKVLVSGDIGRHGTAVMAARDGLEFSTPIESDCALLFPTIDALRKAGIEVRCLRSLCRGGLAGAAVKTALASDRQLLLVAEALVIREDVRVAGEILGLDPLYAANEGRFLAVVDPGDADRAVEILQARPDGEHAAVVGEVEEGSGSAVIENAFGVRRELKVQTSLDPPRIS